MFLDYFCFFWLWCCSKLNIFENSIGELEPILGELEKELNISKLMNLSQVEIDRKLNLKELALERERLEISQHSKEFDKMLNEDLNYKESKNSLLNPLKIEILQAQSRKILINYLEDNCINFLKLKDGDIKLSSQNLKDFFNILKESMSDKKLEALRYKEERELLQKIYRYKELKISFTTNNNDNFQTLYIYLNNPIISIITRDKKYQTIYSTATYNRESYSGYAIIYRVDFRQLKSKSYIKTIIFDDDFNYIEEIDYFEFIDRCSEINGEKDINFEDIKDKSTSYIIKNIERQKVIEEQNQNRQIDIKIESITNHFDKHIDKVKRVEERLLQKDVKRMRIGEIENLKTQRDKKIKELKSQKEINSSFEILGIVRLYR